MLILGSLLQHKLSIYSDSTKMRSHILTEFRCRRMTVQDEKASAVLLNMHKYSVYIPGPKSSSLRRLSQHASPVPFSLSPWIVVFLKLLGAGATKLKPIWATKMNQTIFTHIFNIVFLASLKIMDMRTNDHLAVYIAASALFYLQVARHTVFIIPLAFFA